MANGRSRQVPAPAASPSFRRFDDLTPQQKRVFATPSGFARLYLGMSLYPEQIRIMDALAPQGARVSARICNEGGKTTRIIAGVILWHASVFPRKGASGGVVVTSGAWGQIIRQLIPACRLFSHKFPRWSFGVQGVSDGSNPIVNAFSTKNPGLAEGWHGDPEHPLLAIVDEAKTVPDSIISVLEDRCNPQRLGLFSSTGYSQGEFYRSHSVNAHLYQTFKVTAAQCPHITQESIDRRIARFGGRNHPVLRSALDSEFMVAAENSIIDVMALSDVMENPAEDNGAADRHARIDFAAGGDETVLAVRRGNQVWIEDLGKYAHSADTMATCGKLVERMNWLARKIGLRPEEVEGDADGLGKPMVDRIRSLGWPILEYRANGAAVSDPHYYNRESENWGEAAIKISSRGLAIPNDELLRSQLETRLWQPNNDGLLRVEPKKELRKRLEALSIEWRSPDRAECVVGVLGPLPTVHATQMMTEPQTLGERLAREMGAQSGFAVPEEMIAGMDAGS